MGDRTADKIRCGLAALALVWIAALVGVPQMTGPGSSRIQSGLAVAVYGVGAVICHQLPERSFFVNGTQLPVCARCTGLYAGAALASLVVALRGRRRTPDRNTLRLALVVTALPIVATLGYEWSAHVTPANMTRALSAVPLGAAIAWIVTRVGTATTSVELH